MGLLVIHHQIKLNLAHKDWDLYGLYECWELLPGINTFFVANATQEATVIEGSQYKTFLATVGHSGLLGAEDRLCGCRASGEF